MAQRPTLGERASSPDDPDAPAPTPGTVEVPAYYAREIEAREAICEACPVDVYISSVSDRFGWPWKLTTPNEARPATRRSSRSVMLDTGLTNVEWGAWDPLHAATVLGADLAIARDVSPEHPVAGDAPDRHRISMRTTAHYVELVRHIREQGSMTLGTQTIAAADLPTVVAPVQPPYAEALDALYEPVTNRYAPGGEVVVAEHVDHFAVGGLLEFGPAERVAALRTVRDRLGPDAWVHALAPGTDLRVLAAIRDAPGLVDSLDVSTPERAPANGKVPDKTWTQRKHQFPSGDDSTTVRSAYAAAIAVQLAYMLSDLCDDDVLETALAGAGRQTTLF